MDKVLAGALALMPFITLLVEFVKPLLPAPSDPEKQDAVVHVFTGAVALALALGVYFFTNAAFDKAGLGVTLATAGVAAGMATGLWHGATQALPALLPALAGPKASAPAAVAAPVAPAFAPIPNDPINKPTPASLLPPTQ